MRTHPELGANLLSRFESYREIASVILAHQEHFDGSGDPRGLKGDQIPLFARIIAIADAYHAMTSNRPYRRALPPSRPCASSPRTEAHNSIPPSWMPSSRAFSLASSSCPPSR